jgi:hypothetical protein
VTRGRLTEIRKVDFGHVAADDRSAARREARVNLAKLGVGSEKRTGGRAE